MTGIAIFTEYYGLSRKAVKTNRRIDLVVWPETMFLGPLVTFEPDAARPPDFERHRRRIPPMAAALRPSGDVSLDGPDGPIARRAAAAGRRHGITSAARAQRVFNSAAYVARDGRLLGRYDKMHLVMFGEYVPFAQYFPWLQHLTPLPVSATPGDEPAGRSTLGGVRIAPNICYESVLPHVIRRQVNALAAEGKEPDILVNLTNDGWFWGSSELDMHLACGVFRAVECRKPLLIAANTGFSAWIDGDGRIREQGPRRATGGHRRRAPARPTPQLVSGPRRLVCRACVWRCAGCADWWGFTGGCGRVSAGLTLAACRPQPAQMTGWNRAHRPPAHAGVRPFWLTCRNGRSS